MNRLISIAVIISLTLFFGCSEDKKDNSNPTGPGGANTGTINASISGDFASNFQCTTAYGLQGTANASQGTGGSMHIQGTVTGSDTIMIDIQIYHDPATGTYDLAFPPVDGVGIVSKNNEMNFSESGTATFSQVSSSRMSGTFNFTAFRMTDVGQKVTVTVTSGSFDVPVIASY